MEIVQETEVMVMEMAIIILGMVRKEIPKEIVRLPLL